MVVVFLFACSPVPVPDEPAALAVVVPLTGPDAELGRAAVEGVRFAVELAVEVRVVDEADPDAVSLVEADAQIFGAVAYVGASSAVANLRAWHLTTVPVIFAAPGRYTGVPRAVPGPERAALCAARFIHPEAVLRTDSSETGMTTANALQAAAGLTRVEVVDGASMTTEAGKAGASPVAWAGRADVGGNYLRALRQVGSTAPFLAIGGYLAAAGRYAEGAFVTSVGRVARDETFLRSWIVKHGSLPSAPAIDAYDAAKLLLASKEGVGWTRAQGRTMLGRSTALGAAGPIHLDETGVISPVLCARFSVTNGVFELTEIAEETTPGGSPM